MGLALLSALDSMTSILPVDLLLPLVGYSANQGGILIGTAILAATAGSMVGYLALYAVGARLGRERSRAVLTRIPGIKAEGVDRAEAWFLRHESMAVLFGRILPGGRCFVSIPAGVERMPLRKYLLLSGLGGLCGTPCCSCPGTCSVRTGIGSPTSSGCSRTSSSSPWSWASRSSSCAAGAGSGMPPRTWTARRSCRPFPLCPSPSLRRSRPPRRCPTRRWQGVAAAGNGRPGGRMRCQAGRSPGVAVVAGGGRR
ncbi:DedA family protein [Streptomyces sp. L7]